MLVLSRKTDEQIKIGDSVVITILRTKGNVVRLGIEAPAEVPVLRGELAAKIAEAAASDEAQPSVDDTSAAVQIEFTRAKRSHAARLLPRLLGERSELVC